MNVAQYQELVVYLTQNTYLSSDDIQEVLAIATGEKKIMNTSAYPYINRMVPRQKIKDLLDKSFKYHSASTYISENALESISNQVYNGIIEQCKPVTFKDLKLPDDL